MPREGFNVKIYFWIFKRIKQLTHKLTDDQQGYFQFQLQCYKEPFAKAKLG